MLTAREWRQIKTAIEAAAGFNFVNGGGMNMPKQNVLAILQNYVEDEVVFVEPDKMPKEESAEESTEDNDPPF